MQEYAVKLSDIKFSDKDKIELVKYILTDKKVVVYINNKYDCLSIQEPNLYFNFWTKANDMSIKNILCMIESPVGDHPSIWSVIL